jgi:hypothetical protein
MKHISDILLKKYLATVKQAFSKIQASKNNNYATDPKPKVAKAKIDLTSAKVDPSKASRNPKFSAYISPVKNKTQQQSKRGSNQKAKSPTAHDPSAKREVELLQQKIQQMVC